MSYRGDDYYDNRNIDDDYLDSRTRKRKAYNEPIYLLGLEQITNDFTRVFKVIGSTKHTYTVTINEHPSCTCPDHCIRKITCKHMYFVMLRIMEVPFIHSKYTQKQLMDMFVNMPCFVNSKLIYKYD